MLELRSGFVPIILVGLLPCEKLLGLGLHYMCKLVAWILIAGALDAEILNERKRCGAVVSK